MIRRRTLSEYDRAVWALYTQHLRPMPGVAITPAPILAPVPVPIPEPAFAVPAARALPPSASKPARGRLGALSVGTHPPGVDRATWERFRTGKLPAARTLDLHGRTAARAFSALNGFLAGAHAEGLRCVEVITGRGAGEGGVIRREFPLWLNLPQLRPLVLAASHPHAANPGSVRLLLRRVRG